MIDQDDYIRQLRNKLGLIQNEQTSIDLVLDEDEGVELLQVLQRIIHVGKRTVKSFEGLDEVLKFDKAQGEDQSEHGLKYSRLFSSEILSTGKQGQL